jgi:nitrite reductase/ring-hydroxylating ferredoxin subunit
MNGRPENRPENRIEKIVADLLKGRRLKLRGGDAEEKEAITTAARLAGTRQGPQRMRPEFRRRLERHLEAAPAEGWLTRRAALVAGLGLAAGAAGGGILGRAVEPRAQSKGAGEPVEPRNAVWVDVGSLDDFAEGQGRRVSAGGVGAFVFRRGQTVSAVSSICSHLPCELVWLSQDARLSCSCHPARFMADGKAVGAYGLPPLNPVHARVTAAGRVEVLGTA